MPAEMLVVRVSYDRSRIYDPADPTKNVVIEQEAADLSYDDQDFVRWVCGTNVSKLEIIFETRDTPFSGSRWETNATGAADSDAAILAPLPDEPKYYKYKLIVTTTEPIPPILVDPRVRVHKKVTRSISTR